MSASFLNQGKYSESFPNVSKEYDCYIGINSVQFSKCAQETPATITYTSYHHGL